MFIRILRHVFALAVTLWLATPLAVSAADRTVLVLPFENQTGDTGLDWMGEGIATLTIDRLSIEPSLVTFARSERIEAYRKAGIPGNVVVSRATAIRMGWESGADVVIVGTLSGAAADFGMQARLIDLAALSAFEEVTVSGKLDDVMRLASTLSGKIAGKLVSGGSSVGPGAVVPQMPQPSAFEKYVRGLLTDDPVRRIPLFKESVRLDPSYADAIYELGRAYHDARDYTASRQWLEKVGLSSPHYLDARFLQGLNAFRQGSYVDAVDIFRTLQPSVQSLTNLAAALSRKGEGAQSVLVWRKAADLDPLASDAWFNLGYGSLLESDTGGAIRSFEQSLRMKGRDAETVFLLARAYERAGRTGEAQRLTADAIRISPRIEKWSGRVPPEIERLAVAPVSSSSSSRRRDAASPFWNVVRLERRAACQDLEIWLQAVNKQIAGEAYGEAIRQLREIVMVFSSSPAPHEMLSRIYDQQREFALAIKELETAAALDPSPPYLMALAQAYRKANQTANALEAVERVLKIDPGQPAASALKKELDPANVARPSRRRQ